jgi:hypothetical protein
MKVTFIGHASILTEVGGLTILSDPWWRGPCFGAQWWTNPSPFLAPVEGRRIDYIYVSHAHHDHFHPATLRTLNRDAKVLVSDHWGLAPLIREEGFDVIEINREECLGLGGGVTCRIMPTFGGDTLMALADGREVCLNLNDALHPASEDLQAQFVTQLKQLYPKIDYVFCGYGIASHFPNCYIIPGKDREASAARRQRYFNRQWAKLIAGLAPAYGFPFAADVAFFEEDLFWANEPTHNTERPTDALREHYPQCPTQTRDIAPGFVIEDGKILCEVLRRPVRAQLLRSECRDQIERANRYGIVEPGAVEEVLALLQKNLDECAEYFRSYEGDYRCLIRLRNSSIGIAFEKSGNSLTLSRTHFSNDLKSGYDVILTTRLPYLRQSFTVPFGHEVMFIGSGCLFEYSDRTKVRRNIHKELIHLVRRHSAPLVPRRRGFLHLAEKAKGAIKRMFGMAELDLYDLESWTVFTNGCAPDRSSSTTVSLSSSAQPPRQQRKSADGGR